MKRKIAIYWLLVPLSFIPIIFYKLSSDYVDDMGEIVSTIMELHRKQGDRMDVKNIVTAIYSYRMLIGEGKITNSNLVKLLPFEVSKTEVGEKIPNSFSDDGFDVLVKEGSMTFEIRSKHIPKDRCLEHLEDAEFLNEVSLWKFNAKASNYCKDNSNTIVWDGDLSSLLSEKKAS